VDNQGRVFPITYSVGNRQLFEPTPRTRLVDAKGITKND
jgi:hypothetical protein